MSEYEIFSGFLVSLNLGKAERGAGKYAGERFAGQLRPAWSPLLHSSFEETNVELVSM